MAVLREALVILKGHFTTKIGIYGIYDIWDICYSDIWKYIYIYTLWLFNIAMENGPFMDGLIYLLKMVIFHGYVK